MRCRTISTIVCNNNSTLCINNDGIAISFGFREEEGQEVTFFPPKMIISVQNIQSVALGAHHSVYLDFEGNVFTFGRNTHGQLGIRNDSLQYTCTPQKVNLPLCKEIFCGSGFTLCLTKDGLVYSFGNNFFGQLGLGTNEKQCCIPQIIELLQDVEIY